MSLRLLPLLLVACAVEVEPTSSTSLEPESSSSASSTGADSSSGEADGSSSGGASTTGSAGTEGETAGVQPPWGEPYSACKTDCPAPYECVALDVGFVPGEEVYYQCVAGCDFSDPDVWVTCPPTPGGQPFTCVLDEKCVIDCSADPCPADMACISYESKSICV